MNYDESQPRSFRTSGSDSTYSYERFSACCAGRGTRLQNWATGRERAGEFSVVTVITVESKVKLSFHLLVVATALAQSPRNIIVTSAASFQVGIPARGSIGAVFCTGLALSGTTQAQGAPLPWSLAGVSVTVGGASAPLFSVSDLGGYQQVNFQVPQEAVFANDGSAAITVTQNGATGTAIAQSYPLNIGPGEFFTFPNSPYGAFQHATDYSSVTIANPAHGGETIIGYLTGLPRTVPVVPTGQASPFSPLAVVPQTIPISTSFVDLYTVRPSAVTNFLGLAPGLVGVYQVNFILPSSVGPGDLEIELMEHTCADLCLFGTQAWRFSRSVVMPVR